MQIDNANFRLDNVLHIRVNYKKIHTRTAGMVRHRVSVLHPGVKPLRTQLCPVLDFISEVLHSCRVYDQTVTCWKAYSVLNKRF